MRKILPVNEHRTLLFVGLTISVVVLNGTMIPVALPQIGREMSLGSAQVGWLITGYFLVLGVAVPFFGRLADLYGVSRLYASGLAVFLLGSVACILAPDYLALLGGRLLQGFGAAAVAGLGPTAVSLSHSSRRRGGALGLLNAAAGTAGALGPVTGGFLTDTFGWRYLFAVGILLGTLAPLALKVMPRDGKRGDEGLDWLGGLLLGITVAGTLLALTQGVEIGWKSRLVLPASSAALVAAALLLVQQRIASNPFVPRNLLGNRAYVHLGAITLLLVGIYLTVESIMPLPLAEAGGLSSTQIGIVLLPPALVNASWGFFAGTLVDRYGVRAPLLVAVGIVVIGLLGLSATGAGGSVSITSGLIAVVLAGGTLARVALIKGVSLITPPEYLSSGISINEMIWMVGVGFGTGLFVATSAARSGKVEGLNPLYLGNFVGYSDAFLLLALPPLLAFLASFGLKKSTLISNQGP